MNDRPIHENLDTSFVNLSALLRYLRRRQFDGSIRVELSGYEADIVLTADNEIKVREYDQIAGRVAEGEEALQRILIRAREPGGIIHVYQNVPQTAEKPQIRVDGEQLNREAIVDRVESVIEPSTPPPPPVAAAAPAVPAGANYVVHPATNGNGNGNGNGHAKHVLPDLPVKTEDPAAKGPKLPDFPFELSNNFENRARQAQLPLDEWQTLLNLAAELLRTVDNALANADLDFTAAFKKACGEIAADFPFFDPASKVFSYGAGKIRITEQINPKLFTAGVNSALRRIFDKLAANTKFADTHRYTVAKVAELIHSRKLLYDKFYFTPQLEKIIGA